MKKMTRKKKISFFACFFYAILSIAQQVTIVENSSCEGACHVIETEFEIKDGYVLSITHRFFVYGEHIRTSVGKSKKLGEICHSFVPEVEGLSVFSDPWGVSYYYYKGEYWNLSGVPDNVTRVFESNYFTWKTVK